MSTKLKETNEKQNNLFGGVLLVGLGLLFLINQFVTLELGLLFLPGLAFVFLLWGVVSRNPGLMIPGGILAGIGLGALAVESPLANLVEDDGGLFMLFFASGWVLITLFTAVFTKETHWWPLIPASIMALIGLAITFGGLMMTILTLVSKGWPLILIVIGVYILLKARQTPYKAADFE